MTQVPRPQWLSGIPVVPESAPDPERPAAASTAPAPPSHGLPGDLHNALVQAICETGIPVVAASAVAEAIGAHPELLDALVAFRQQHRVITTREQLAAARTGTVIRTRQGDVYGVDHGGVGEWTGGRTHIYPWLPDWGCVFYPANFDLSLPVDVLWSPGDTKGETDA